MKVNINTDAAVKFTNKLEKMHKSALPSAVRGALNKAVFDVKTKTMPSKANQAFEQRQQNFFKANSRFENAKGFDIKTMKSTVGFVSSNLKGSHNHAVADLEQQESGGIINRKSFIPLPGARIGNSNTKNVRANARLSTLKKIVDARKVTARNKRAQFSAAAAIAGKGGNVLSGRILWRITSLKETSRGHEFKKTAIYSFKRGRSVRVGATGFMRAASEQSADKLNDFFVQEAKRQIEKFTK